MHRKPVPDVPVPPIPKSSGFLKAAGRTFSFGGQKKYLPPLPVAEESQSSSPDLPEPTPPPQFSGRARATTTSTDATVTPPKLESDFNLDLGGDFSKMLLGYDKRASMMTLKEEQGPGHQTLAPRTLTGTRMNHPSPIEIDKTTKVEPSPFSWNSQSSNDRLLALSPALASPAKESTPVAFPRQPSPLAGRRPGTSPEPSTRTSLLNRQPSYGDGEDEEARLLKDSLSAVSKFMSGGGTAAPNGSSFNSRYRRDEDSLDTARRASRFDSRPDDEDLFGGGMSRHKVAGRNVSGSKPSPPRGNKVMTPAEFERYRKDKERQDRERQEIKASLMETPDLDPEDEDNYEDDEDDVEKARQQAKQRQKQEAHMTVYRQQMMKVTGEAANLPPSRPSLSISFSTPNLPHLGPSPPGGVSPNGVPSPSDNSDEDEEIPLAILAAHGFPAKNRPPTRLNNMMSNPNLRAAVQPSYQRPGSAAGETPGAGSRLPAFARNLPQDPFLGAGLINNPVRESFALGGGSPAPGQSLPPGGLVGVIANEERSRAMRRGSPHIDNHPMPPPGGAAFDPIGGIPPNMMYQAKPATPMLSPGDQAQIHMTQQMQQFMQMQMQFMQMMAQNGANVPQAMGQFPPQLMGGAGYPMGGMMPGPNGMMGNPDAMRHSFVGQESMLDMPRGDMQMRTMSMVQPSSASWIQPPPQQTPGYTPSIHAPSIRFQGDYAPSIAPSERSNVGLPGRYRPVSHVPPPQSNNHLRQSSTMSGALAGWPEKQTARVSMLKPLSGSDDEDDEQGWEAMKAKREKKRSIWRSKKDSNGGLAALIS